MRRPLPVIILLFSSALATAQVHEKEYNELVRALLTRQVPAASKTTATGQRVIAESGYRLDGAVPTATDSIFYSYSGGRGSKFDFGNVSFLNYYYDYSPAQVYLFAPGQIPPEPDVRCDSFFLYQSDPAGTLTLRQQEKRGYTAGGVISQSESFGYSGGQATPYIRYTNTFDAQGRISRTSGVEYDPDPPGGWINPVDVYYFYDAAGRSAGDSIVSVTGAGYQAWRRIMTYDAGGKLVSLLTRRYATGTWQNTMRYDVSYYPSGRMQRIVTTDYFTGSPNFYSTDSFVYAPGIDLYAERHMRDAQGYQRILHRFNTQGLPDTVIRERFDPGSGTWNPASKKTFWYNSMNNPVECLYDNTFPQYQLRHRYYYEEYETLKVPALHAAGLKIYPNPVAAALCLEWKDASPSALYNLSIADMTGRQVYHIRWNGQLLQINTAAWASGVYALVLTGSKGETVHTQLLVKE